MDTRKKYDIPLKDINAEKQRFMFHLDDEYFEQIDQTDIKGGDAQSIVSINKQGGLYHLLFEIRGEIRTLCSRCLDEVSLSIDYTDTLKIKLGSEFDEIEDIIIVPEHQGRINVSWYIYEFIALHTPMQRRHKKGECNKGMVEKLKEHTYHIRKTATTDTENEKEIDPRWAKLKNIKDNNLNN